MSAILIFQSPKNIFHLVFVLLLAFYLNLICTCRPTLCFIRNVLQRSPHSIKTRMWKVNSVFEPNLVIYKEFLKCFCESSFYVKNGSRVPEGSKETSIPNISPNKLLSQISSLIRFDGPITVAQYMQEILTNPRQGYYMSKDVFGVSGDFTTSPEVSQMFGECIGIWILMEWMKMGSPKPVHLVEFGPGRGTLMCDILRTLAKLTPDCVSSITVHMVEVSPFLTQVQETNLCGLSASRTKEAVKNSKYGTKIAWHEDLSQVPKGLESFSYHFNDLLGKSRRTKMFQVFQFLLPTNSLMHFLSTSLSELNTNKYVKNLFTN